MRRVGYLSGLTADDGFAQGQAAAFRQGLQKLGWTEGRNVRIDFRWSGPDNDRIRAHAAELVALAPEVILAGPAQVVQRLREVTQTIPIVFANVPDPVALGLIRSLADPGGNITGFTSIEDSMSAKWFELLREMVPGMARVGVLYSPVNPAWAGRLRVIEAIAPSLGVRVTAAAVRDVGEIDHVIGAIARDSNDGLIVLPAIFLTSWRERIVASAARHRLPAVYAARHFTDAGGLVSYGADVEDQFRRAASYVDRILKGEKPANLPVQAPTKFELVINLKTAKVLGLQIPPMLLGRADEVIE
jgi:putative ABC transport system substrate-binding protein